MRPLVKVGWIAAGYVVAGLVAFAVVAINVAATSDSQASSGMSAFGDSLLFAWSPLAVLRILVAPMFALAFLLSSLFAPNRNSRIALLGATAIEACGLRLRRVHPAPAISLSLTTTFNSNAHRTSHRPARESAGQGRRHVL